MWLIWHYTELQFAGKKVHIVSILINYLTLQQTPKFKPLSMLNNKTFITILLLVLCSFIANAQFNNYSKPDSLQKVTELSLDLKLHYQPIYLSINSGELTKNTRNIYLFNQMGMYEQYSVNSVNGLNSYMLQPYKAYVPTGFINYNGNNINRDSFNPHGSNDIGNALINGFINGIILGNKY